MASQRALRKEQTTSFGVKSMRSRVLCWAAQVPPTRRLTSRGEKADLIAAETPASEAPLGSRIHSHGCKAHLSCYGPNVDDQASLQASTSPTSKQAYTKCGAGSCMCNRPASNVHQTKWKFGARASEMLTVDDLCTLSNSWRTCLVWGCR